MNVLGIVGGLGPESTIDYYRQLIAAYRKRIADDSYPAIIIASLDVSKALRLVGAQQYDELADYFAGAFEQLARAGATVGLISANTPHIVFDQVQARSAIPIISIVEAACAAVRQQGMSKVALLGTRFTMQGRFYPDVFSRTGIALVVPTDDEQSLIHEKYVDELIPGVFLDATRQRLIGIIRRLQQEERVQGVLLAGTELPLILRQQDVPEVPLLDTTAIHVEAAVTRLLS